MKAQIDRSRVFALVAVAVAVIVVAGCGSEEDSNTETADAATGQYTDIKNYLTGQTKQLDATVGELQAQAAAYAQQIEAAGGCEKAVANDPEDVKKSVEKMQATWRKANPQYEKAEGVVAGVPSLAEYDVILDAGASAEDDPEGAVPFDLKYADGTTLKQPGNFFFLTETSLWGTTPEFTCEGTEVEVEGTEQAVPLPEHITAAAEEMKKYTAELDRSSNEWQPTEDDVFTAVVVMTPTMSEYFDAWKNSRFVAGDDADEASFVGTSRLNDIADILSGLVLVYDNIEPQIAEEDPDQARQTGEDLQGLYDYVARIRDEEADGTQFTAEQADTYGSEAQERAERIAGQVSQSASQLGVTIQE